MTTPAKIPATSCRDAPVPLCVHGIVKLSL